MPIEGTNAALLRQPIRCKIRPGRSQDDAGARSH